MSDIKKYILVVDDEEQIVSVVKAYLEKEGYGVYTAFSGKEALDIFDKTQLDFIILDLMLPDKSGEELCKIIRKKSHVPIIMLTAKVEESDKLNGLIIGADDYLTKPFSPRELIVRIKTILRRVEGGGIKSDLIEFNNEDIVIDLTKMEVKKRGVILSLTPTEFDILALLARNSGRVFTREELINRVLGYDYEGYDRTIDVHIKNLRQKIEDIENKYIKTVYKVGYKFLGE